MSDRVGILLQARMSSARLPGKALCPLNGAPLLRRLANRMGASRRSAVVVLATSDRPADDALAEAAGQWGVPVFRGPEADLVTRLLGAAEAHDLAAFVRVTGDNPLTDPAGVDALLDAWISTRAAVVHNKHRRGYPYGTGAEVVAVEALERCAVIVKEGDAREDFVGWMRSHPEDFPCVALDAPPELLRPAYFLTVDYPEDLRLFETVYARFGGDDRVPLASVLAFLDGHPDVAKINQHLHVPFAS